MTPEGKVKAHVKKLLKRYDVYTFMPVQRGLGAAGLDFHCIHHGIGLCIETKAPGKNPTPRQETTMEQVRNAGGATFVVSGPIDQSILEAWLQGVCLTYGCTKHPVDNPGKLHETVVWGQE